MSETLDLKIQKLFKIVQDKKAKLAKLDRFNPKTNCSFKYPYSEKPINLHVQPASELVRLLGWLIQDKNRFDLGCKTANVDFKYSLNDYSFDDWSNDIITLISKKNIEVEKRDLFDKENKLNTLISPEEKRRLEIESLEKELED